MTYIICGGLAILTYIKKDSKVIMFLIFSFLMILFTFADKIPDLHNYELEYIDRFPDVTEPIYVELRKLFVALGLKYIHYRFFLGLVGFGLISAFILEYSPKPAIVLFFYLIYPLAIDAVQVRSFVAYAFVVFGLRYIIKYHENPHPKYIFSFVLMLLLGMGFHASILLYSIFLALFLKPDRNKAILYLAVPASIFAAALFIYAFMPIIVQLVGTHKAENWASETRMISLPGIIRISFPKYAFVAFLLFTMCFSPKNNRVLDVSNIVIKGRRVQSRDRYTDTIILLATLYGFSTVAFEIFVAGDYERMSRVSLIWGNVLATRVISRFDQSKRFVLWAVWYCLYALYFVSVFILRSMTHGFITESFFEYIFVCFMENNKLIS